MIKAFLAVVTMFGSLSIKLIVSLDGIYVAVATACNPGSVYFVAYNLLPEILYASTIAALIVKI